MLGAAGDLGFKASTIVFFNNLFWPCKTVSSIVRLSFALISATSAVQSFFWDA